MALVMSNNAAASSSLGSKTQLAVFSATTPKRTSNLAAPIMKLSGHAGEILSCRFDPTGNTLATAGFDTRILLWNIYGECNNFAVLEAHKNAVLELSWSKDGAWICSASADRSMIQWDAEHGIRVRRYRDHSSFVNSCCMARHSTYMAVTGSDDGTAKIFDLRERKHVQSINCSYPVTAVSFSESGQHIFAGGIDNCIKVWDLRKDQEIYRLQGHSDTITGLRLAPNGDFLLSNSMDNTLRTWDVRPYCPDPSRQSKIFTGHRHNVDKNLLRCCWSTEGNKIAAASSDSPTHVYIWDANTTQIIYKLPGHKAAVNDVDFHPKEPILASASSDKSVFLGEIEV